MLQLRFDSASPYAVRMPRNNQHPEVVDLARRFVAYEVTRPEGERTPITRGLAALLDETTPHLDHRQSSEIQRAKASEAIKRLDEEAKLLTHQIWTTINYFFKTTPERAPEWGFEIRQSTRRIIKPDSREARLAVLTRYIAKEESRPEHERFSIPDLNTVKRVRNDLAGNLAARQSGKTQREVSIIHSEALAEKMFNHLQFGAAYLLAQKFNYTITPDLEHWGFNVVLVRTGNGNGHGNGNGNGHSDTNGNGSSGLGGYALP